MKACVAQSRRHKSVYYQTPHCAALWADASGDTVSEPQVGVEPTAYSLRKSRSATELEGHTPVVGGTTGERRFGHQRPHVRTKPFFEKRIRVERS